MVFLVKGHSCLNFFFVFPLAPSCSGRISVVFEKTRTTANHSPCTRNRTLSGFQSFSLHHCVVQHIGRTVGSNVSSSFQLKGKKKINWKFKFFTFFFIIVLRIIIHDGHGLDCVTVHSFHLLGLQPESVTPHAAVCDTGIFPFESLAVFLLEAKESFRKAGSIHSGSSSASFGCGQAGFRFYFNG